MTERAMLRVCWFTNVPLPKACDLLERPSPLSGGWLSGLANALVSTGQVKLQVITSVIGKGGTVTDADGTTHVLLGMDANRYSREVQAYPSGTLRQMYLDEMETFNADIVHFHGTEFSYGLLFANNDITIPAVVSLQGFLDACFRRDFAGIALGQRLWNCGVQGILHPASMLRGTEIKPRRLRDEAQILRSPAQFVGRTLFDRAYLHSVNPSARYCHCDEILRPEFVSRKRDSNRIIRHSIFAPSSSYPRKGFHCILAAVALLKKDFPDITVRVPGRKPRDSWRAGWYERYLRKIIGRWDLERQLTFLGDLNAESVALELVQANVFGYPSFVDNSPNALAEAMLVGVPVVTSYVGGIPSMVRDRETALCFPVGDEIVMAECIRTLFRDPELAQHLADNAQQTARVRHDSNRVAKAMLEIYRQVLGDVL